MYQQIINSSNIHATFDHVGIITFLRQKMEGRRSACLENWTFSNEGRTALLQFTSKKNVFAILPVGYR